MPIRTNIETFRCIQDVACGDTITDVWGNSLKDNVEAIANTGSVVFSGGGQSLNGYRFMPLNGWSTGNNWNPGVTTTYHMIETTQLFNRFVLQAEVMLADPPGNRAMQWIKFLLYDPATGNEQRLSEVKRNNLGITPPIEIGLAPNTKLRIRIDGALDANFIPAAGNGVSIDFRTEITSYGDPDMFSVTDDWYWGGVLYANLKFYKSCL